MARTVTWSKNRTTASHERPKWDKSASIYKEKRQLAHQAKPNGKGEDKTDIHDPCGSGVDKTGRCTNMQCLSKLAERRKLGLAYQIRPFLGRGLSRGPAAILQAARNVKDECLTRLCRSGGCGVQYLDLAVFW